jgi:hypothetical protein
MLIAALIIALFTLTALFDLSGCITLRVVPKAVSQ